MNQNTSKNKGFTLVELIVIIAIISVLATVLAPQYTRYVESARRANDLQVATNIVTAVKAAIVDPQSNIPQGHFIEILWISGEESGPNVTKGSLLIRHNDKYRTSIFNDGKGDDDVPATTSPDGGYKDSSNLEKFAESVFEVLGGDSERISDYTGWLQITFQDAESELANMANLALHVNTSTGEVAMAATPSTLLANPNRWVALGLDVTAHPDYAIEID